MLKIITDQREVRKCQKALEERLTNSLGMSNEYIIGFPSGNWNATVNYNNTIWYSTYEIEGKRYWNGFGVVAELNTKKSNNIVVEVNPPLNGINKSVSGIFAKNSKTNRIYLLHRGKIGGGRKGIGKKAFLDWYKKELVTLNDSSNKEHHAIMIGEIASESFIDNLEKFVSHVYEFKSLVSSGLIDESTYLSDEELLEKAKEKRGSKNKTTKNTKVHARNPFVAEFAKRRAKGKCQLCSEFAPFENKIGRPYLEVHHVIWLSKGGNDSIDNTVAICPNCHRKMHILDRPSDIKKLKQAANNLTCGST